MSKRRIFTPAFKANVVVIVLTGAKAAAQVCREHQAPGVKAMPTAARPTVIEPAPS